MDEAGRFYTTETQAGATHFALRWKGQLRFTVPRDAAAQNKCWRFFQPGLLRFPLRAATRLPRLLGSLSCIESNRLASIKEQIGAEAWISCCRAGAPGPWSKDTILLMDRETTEPLCVVKAGTGAAVESLLQNEAQWLHVLRDEVSLTEHIPKLLAHSSSKELFFVAQSPVSGRLDYGFGEAHIAFLRKLQQYSRKTMRLEESSLYRSLRSRLKNLDGLLTEVWSTRLEKGMRCIDQTLCASPVMLVAAHNDFTPWNIRVEHGAAKVFDWEYADYEQLPLFDPLHFVLMPMAMGRQSTARMVHRMGEALRQSRQWLGVGSCYEAQTQALAYLINLCTLYLWGARKDPRPHPVLNSYARLIDHIVSMAF